MTAFIHFLLLLAQTPNDRPVANAVTVMEIVSAQKDHPLWPDFRPTEIPVLVFDSADTWLFFSKDPPEGFTALEQHPGIFLFKGQHPLVRGNSIVRLGDRWTATSVFSSHARRTGEQYAARDLAGIIIHEQFHVFQREKHPRWRQNDGVLLLYPPETTEALLLRRSEKEAFRRAVISDNPKEITGWVREAVKYREQRFALFAPVFATYEKELQRTEGLSDYIERVARGLDPLNASNMTNGIAPAGVRDLGYVEGRWIAMILDKLAPDWKTLLEANDSLYLEDILKRVTDDRPYEAESFSATGVDQLQSEAGMDFVRWQEKKQHEMKQFNDQPGFRVEIVATSNPLAIRIFEPLEIEILDDGNVYHRLIFSAGNDAGSLRIMNHPCITEFDNSLRVTRVLIHGLDKEPEINEPGKTVKIKEGSSTVELKYTRANKAGLSWIIEL
jgi:hypothetical protein